MLDEITWCHDFRRKLISTPRLILVTKLLASRTLDNGSSSSPCLTATGEFTMFLDMLTCDMLLILGDLHVRTCTPVCTVQEAMPIQVGKKILLTWNSSWFKNCGWPTHKVRDFLSFLDFRVSVFWILLGAFFFILSMGLEDTGGRVTLQSRVQLRRALIAFARSGFAGAFDSDPHRV